MDNESMIALCGLDCGECPGYIATQEDDDSLRRETAAKWSEEHDSDLTSDDINCDGCTSDGKHLDYCNVCEIRACGLERGVENCSYCDDYVCGVLDRFLQKVPKARQTLDEIHQNL